jgi:hypothetical protein
MRQSLLVCTAVAVLGTSAACSSSGTATAPSAGPASPAVASSAATPATADQLKAQLVGTSAFPAGWRETDRAPGEEGAAVPSSCPLLESHDMRKLPAYVERTFGKDPSLGEVATEILATGGEPDVVGIFQAYSALPSNCPTITQKAEDGTEIRYEIKRVVMPSLGASATAAQFTAEVQGHTSTLYNVVALKGDVLMSLTEGGQTADQALAETVAGKALAAIH